MLKILQVSHINNVVCETGSALIKDGGQEKNAALLPPSGAPVKLLPRVCNRLPGRRRAALVYVECGSSGTHG